MKPIAIRPHRYRQLGSSEGATFCFVTNSNLVDNFTIEKDGSYEDYQTFTYDPGDDFCRILQQLPEPAHIFVASPGSFFSSEVATQLGNQRKLLVMPCNSTPTSLEALKHFLDIVEKTDPAIQEDIVERFFSIGENSDYLEIVDDFYGTVATFNHLNESYEWFEQAGYVDWGGQQMVPAGEISCLPLEIDKFNAGLRFEINGKIAIKGHPIVHSGPVSFLPEDQARIYQKLSCICEHAIIATVINGVITEITPTHPSVFPAVQMLNAMFEVDSRYRIIWEVGFAINTVLEILPGNFAMNEVYGAKNGSIHWGLGIMPYTQYHMDLICPDLSVVGQNNEVLIGQKFDRSLRSSEIAAGEDNNRIL